MENKHNSCLIKEEEFEKEYELMSALQQPRPLARLCLVSSPANTQVPFKFGSRETAPLAGASF